MLDDARLRVDPDLVDELLEVVVETDAPWDYVLWLLADVANRNEFALGLGVLRMVVSDLRGSKWLNDREWDRHRRELELEQQARERQGKIDEWWAEQAREQDRVEELWTGASIDQKRAWSEYFTTQRADVLPAAHPLYAQHRADSIREWTIDALLEHGPDAMPPRAPPAAAITLNHNEDRLAAMRAKAQRKDAP